MIILCPPPLKPLRVNLEKTENIDDEDEKNLNEDMEDYLGRWVEDQANSLNPQESTKAN